MGFDGVYISGTCFPDVQSTINSQECHSNAQRSTPAEMFLENQAILLYISYEVNILIISECQALNEPHHQKTNILHMRTQRRRSASQLREADQPLCFRYTDSTIPLLPISKIPSHYENMPMQYTEIFEVVKIANFQ